VACKHRVLELLVTKRDGQYLDVGGGNRLGSPSPCRSDRSPRSGRVVDRSATMPAEASRRSVLAVVGAAEALPFGA
jgi:hypothetical protein